MCIFISCFSLIASSQNTKDTLVIIEKAVAGIANHNIEIDEPIALFFEDKKFYHFLKIRGDIKVYNSVELFNKYYH